MGCRYLDIEEKKIFEFNGEIWKEVNVLGNYGIIMVFNPPSAYYVDGDAIKKCKKKDLKRFGL